MNFTNATVIEDSIDIHQQRLTTLVATFPRCVLAEFNTHRQFSKSTNSSRASPFHTMLANVSERFYIPEDVRLNQSGMQGFERLDEEQMETFKEWYYRIWEHVSEGLEHLYEEVKVHKQHINKIYENFGYVDMVVTSTEWQNFLNLRDHEAAHPEMQKLAKLVRIALESSVPTLKVKGEYHLPFITQDEKEEYQIEQLIKASISRNARTSYKLFDGTNVSVNKDVKLYEKLTSAIPAHASPLEHVAVCTEKLCVERFEGDDWVQRNRFYNLHGWKSFRFMFEKEGVRL